MDWLALGAQAILALVPVATALLTFAVRTVIPKIPRFAIPVVAMGLGFALTWVHAAAAGPEVAFNPLLGAALGAAATWLREMISTVNEHGAKA